MKSIKLYPFEEGLGSRVEGTGPLEKSSNVYVLM